VNKNIWSEDELNYLVNNYSHLTINELILTINKTRRRIIRKLTEMGLQYLTEKNKRNSIWTQENDDYLIKNYHNNLIPDLAKHLNMDYYKVRDRINFLKLEKISQKERGLLSKVNKFSEQIIDKIREQSETLSGKKISEYHNLTMFEVNNICKFYNIKLKNKFELLRDIDEKIKKIGEDKSISYISSKLNLKYNLVFRRCLKLNINYINDCPKWNEDEKALLAELAIDTPLDDIKLIMHRSTSSVVINARKLNIELIQNKYIDRKRFTSDQLEFLKNNYNNYNLLELCKHLNIDSRSLILKMYLLNLFNLINMKNVSLLENVVAKILTEMNVNYNYQYKIKNGKLVVCDFKINNKIIEVYGDYWHGRDMPHKKRDPRNLTQIRADNAIKEQFIIDNNYELLIIWEYDIINNLSEVYKNVKKYLEL